MIRRYFGLFFLCGFIFSANLLQANPESATSKPAPSTESRPYMRPSVTEPQSLIIDVNKKYEASIVTSKGEIKVQLDAKAAPWSVNNFVYLARAGFYNGLTFHRVEPNFVIQGGDPVGNGTGGPGYTVKAEIGLKHLKGSLAWARQGDFVNPQKRSSGSQFYFCLNDLPGLDGNYTVFGQTLSGMEVAEQIEVGDLIEKVTISEK